MKGMVSGRTHREHRLRAWIGGGSISNGLKTCSGIVVKVGQAPVAASSLGPDRCKIFRPGVKVSLMKRGARLDSRENGSRVRSDTSIIRPVPGFTWRMELPPSIFLCGPLVRKRFRMYSSEAKK